MKYYSTLISLFILNLFSIFLLLYFANITRNLEKENLVINSKINFLEGQININEIEYSLYNSYDFLQKMKKIYLNDSDNQDYNNRISFYDLKTNYVDYLYTIGIN